MVQYSYGKIIGKPKKYKDENYLKNNNRALIFFYYTTCSGLGFAEEGID